MLLNGGELDGRRCLSPAALKFLSTPQTPETMPMGFFQSGVYGHGGAWGTQAWIDPVKNVACVLMVQRSNFPNIDASDVRRDFQQAASDALAKR